MRSLPQDVLVDIFLACLATEHPEVGKEIAPLKYSTDTSVASSPSPKIPPPKLSADIRTQWRRCLGFCSSFPRFPGFPDAEGPAGDAILARLTPAPDHPGLPLPAPAGYAPRCRNQRALLAFVESRMRAPRPRTGKCVDVDVTRTLEGDIGRFSSHTWLVAYSDSWDAIYYLPSVRPFVDDDEPEAEDDGSADGDDCNAADFG
ncbi:hypothetical protein B0H10DRAFT_2211630 [Mycena sp. CBHHK59/15]|nr:hypothetical protein B0H10DRAFT_2211630 [Mycena sp. CBHHK59/15]